MTCPGCGQPVDVPRPWNCPNQHYPRIHLPPPNDFDHAIAAIMHAIADLKHHVTEGFRTMSTVADNTASAVTTLDTKVDTLIAAIGPGIQALRDQLAAAQAQVTSLLAGDAADATTLQATITAALAEAAKVDAAITALTPPVTPTV